GTDRTRACNGGDASAFDQIYRRSASPNPPISRRSEDQDAWIPECAGSRSPCGGTSMERRSSRDDARGRRSEFVFVYRRFFRVARMEDRRRTAAIPTQVRQILRQLQF